jgi:hypothetical protein
MRVSRTMSTGIPYKETIPRQVLSELVAMPHGKSSILPRVTEQLDGLRQPFVPIWCPPLGGPDRVAELSLTGGAGWESLGNFLVSASRLGRPGQGLCRCRSR